MPDGSVRLTIGDLEAAPEDPEAEQVTDHREPSRPHECARVRYLEVRGWWCRTTVEKIRVSGDIVISDDKPSARIQGAGFSTRCSQRPGRMRQRFQIERDSWRGWRSYGRLHTTSWTSNQSAAMGAVGEDCPLGRVGTYDYRLAVWLDTEQAPAGSTPAASAQIRTHCGTGAS
jgi:hypothetical protein